MENKIIVIKVGTQVLTKEDGKLNLGILQSLIEQIVKLRDKGHKIVLVSSGAVGAGRIPLSNYQQTRILAAIGQPKLLQTYSNIANSYNLLIGQLLVTKEDFKDRAHYLNIRDTILEMLTLELLPIANENDVISNPEVFFTDNDELAGLLATMIGASELVILTNVDGVYTGHPEKKGSKLVHTIDPAKVDYNKYISKINSKSGRGGMQSKCNIAAKLAELGITTTIANGKTKDILLKATTKKNVGTRFISQGTKSNIKKWLAHSQEFYSGTITINTGAREILLNSNASLLPIGIISTENNFSKKDIIRIVDQDKKIIGIGLSSYDSKQLEKNLGKPNKKPFIHRDNLYLINTDTNNDELNTKPKKNTTS